MKRGDGGICLGPIDRVTKCETVAYFGESGLQLATFTSTGDDVEAVWLPWSEAERLRLLLNERASSTPPDELAAARDRDAPSIETTSGAVGVSLDVTLTTKPKGRKK